MDLVDWVGNRFPGRFRALRTLASDRRTATLLALDRESHAQVVLKIISEHVLSPGGRARLRHALAALGRRPVEGLVSSDLLTGDPDGDRPEQRLCLMRRFVAGETLAERLRIQRVSVRDAVSLAVVLCATLEEIHAAGLVHRNIKPSNILYPEDPAVAPLLVDLGLIRPGDADARLEDALYLAPEQSGLIEASVDGRADLYSLGAVLYEALTGVPPFRGNSIGELLRQHLSARPPVLVGSMPDVPAALEQMIERLLRKDPRDRYQTAGGARADFEDLAAALDAGVAQPDIVVGRRDRRTALAEPAFIGRSEELAALEERVDAAAAGSGGIALVEGDPGLGKSWLLEELGNRARARGAWVLHGRGVDPAARAPFHVLTEVARELVASLPDDRDLRSQLRERLGPLGPVAAAALPELEGLFGADENRSLGPDRHGEVRSLMALSALIDTLGSARKPLLLLLDDGQWADDFTLRLLSEWQKSAPPDGKRFVLIVLAFRPEQVHKDSPIRTLRPDRRCVLHPFGDDDVRKEVASMAGHLPEAAVDAVCRYSSGNPFLVMALVQGLVESGALTADPAGWRLDPEALAGLRASHQMADIMTPRIARLTGDRARLLRVGALLGRTFDNALAAALAGMPLERAVAELHACRGSLIWVDASDDRSTFVHDLVREALLAGLGAEERRRLHRMAAERIHAEDPERVFELAYHYDSAGARDRALPHALEAAERARQRFALEVAEHNYQIAMRAGDVADRADRLRATKGLAETLTLRGSYEKAEELFARALDLTRDAREAADVEERWAQLSLKRGDLGAACQHGEEALRQMGCWVPGKTWACTAACTWELAVQVLHTHFPGRFVGRKPQRDPEREQFILRLYNGMNGPYFFAKGPMWAGWAHLRHLNLAERAPPTVELARAYATHAATLSGFPGLFERGLRISRKGAEMCAELGDLEGEAEAWTFHSMTLHFAGRFDESVEVGHRASALYDRIGDRWLANSGLDFAVTSLLRKGELEECVRLAKKIHERASAIGDAHALAWSLDAWSRATEGRVPRPLVEAERERSGEHIQTSVVVSIAEGVLLLGENRLADAEQVFAKAVTRVRKEIRFYNDLIAPVAVYRVTALRRQIEEVPAWTPRRKRELQRRAEKALRHALRVARTFRNSLPHALREAAYLAAFRGEERRARKLIDESIDVAAQLGQNAELAQSRLTRGEIGAALGWVGADRERRRAREDLDALRAFVAVADGGEETEAPEVTLSLIDRYATVLEAGHRIATALSTEAAYSELRAATLALLRAERCAILQPSGGRESGAEDMVPVYGDAVVPSEAVIQRAVDEGQPAVLDEGRAPDDSRSALCAPIFVRGRLFALLYASHRQVGGLFNEEAKQITRFLITVTGAALENAEGFARVQALSRSLERRVDERTAQLADANAELEQRLQQLRATQDQLVQAGKMAAIGTLVAGLSHELNSPLNVILGFTQTLLDKLPQGSESERPLRAVERNALRCRQLVKSLLDFSRNTPSERSLVAPRSLVDGVIEFASAEARGRGIDLELDLAPGELPVVRISSQEIESALLNLLSNALYATTEKGSVTLGLREASEHGTLGVEFSVGDTGPGIPSSLVPQVFDPFFTTKPVGEGTGLGLSLARQIVEAHDGRLDIETEEGRGTLVRLWLPAERPREGSNGMRESLAQRSKGSAPP